MRIWLVIGTTILAVKVSGQISSFSSLDQGMNWSVMEFEEDTVADVLYLG